MTNYIDEMMRTAGVEPKYKYLIKGNTVSLTVDKDWIIRHFKDRKFQSVYKIIKVEKYYPDFTPAKQLEIIKLILLADNIDCLASYYSEIMNSYVFECFSLPELGERSSWAAQNKDFALALAELTVMLMNAGELDKQKVKEILEK